LLDAALYRRYYWNIGHHFDHDSDPLPDPHDPHHPDHLRPYFVYDPFADLAFRAYAEQSRAASEASRVSAQEEAFRRGQQERLNVLDRQASAVLEQQRVAEREARRVAGLADSNARWASTKLERLTLLEAFAQKGYESRLTYDRLGYWEGAGELQTERFAVTGKVWKIDLKVTGNGKARVTVMSADSERPVAVLPWQTAPGWTFLVLDNLGRHTLRVDTIGSVTYTLESVQVSG